MDLREPVIKVVDWIQTSHYRVHWWDFLDMLLDLCDPQNEGISKPNKQLSTAQEKAFIMDLVTELDVFSGFN
jgi:hypothetical protein